MVGLSNCCPGMTLPVPCVSDLIMFESFNGGAGELGAGTFDFCHRCRISVNGHTDGYLEDVGAAISGCDPTAIAP
jgi:hypothetical protein